MTNLKKVLALALVFALSFTLFASAAFVDQKDISFVDEVGTLVSLNVIAGYPEGDFKPKANVTRAEFTKMLYCLKMGVDDNGVPFKGLSIPFSDVADTHWAKGYIGYMYSLGVIVGKGNNTFDPDANVTGLEALKMTLVMLGYAPNGRFDGYQRVDELVGANWAANTLRLSGGASLTERYPTSLTDAATRELCALILYNSLTSILQDGEYRGYTLGWAHFGLRTWDGVLTAVHQKDKNSMTINGNVAGSGYFEVDGRGERIVEMINGVVTNPGFDTGVRAFKSETAYDSLGKAVKVLYKEEKATNTYVAYGVVESAKNQVWSGIMGSVSYSKTGGKNVVSFDGYKITVDQVTIDAMSILNLDPAYNAGASAPIGYGIVNAASANMGSDAFNVFADSNSYKYGPLSKSTVGNQLESNAKFTLIDNTGDGKPDFGYIDNYKLAKITDISNNKVTLAIRGDYDVDDKKVVATTNLTFSGAEALANLDIYKGAKKNDFTWVSVGLDGRYTATAAVKQEVTFTTVPKGAAGSIKADGVDYRLFNKFFTAQQVADSTTVSKQALEKNGTYDVILDAGRRNYIAYCSEQKYGNIDLSEYGIVVDYAVVDDNWNSIDTTYKVKILTTTNALVEIKLASGDDVIGKALSIGTAVADDHPIEFLQDKLWRFEKCEDNDTYNVYNLTQNGNAASRATLQTNSDFLTLDPVGSTDTLGFTLNIDGTSTVFVGVVGNAESKFYGVANATPGSTAGAATTRTFYRAYDAASILPSANATPLVSLTQEPILYNIVVGDKTRNYAALGIMTLAKFPDSATSYKFGMITGDISYDDDDRSVIIYFNALVDGVTRTYNTKTYKSTGDWAEMKRVVGTGYDLANPNTATVSDILFTKNYVRIYTNASGAVVELKPGFPVDPALSESGLSYGEYRDAATNAVVQVTDPDLYHPTADPADYSRVGTVGGDDFFMFAGALISNEYDRNFLTIKNSYTTRNYFLDENCKVYSISVEEGTRWFEWNVSSIKAEALEEADNVNIANVMYKFADADKDDKFDITKDKYIDFILTCKDNWDGESNFIEFGGDVGRRFANGWNFDESDMPNIRSGNFDNRAVNYNIKNIVRPGDDATVGSFSITGAFAPAKVSADGMTYTVQYVNDTGSAMTLNASDFNFVPNASGAQVEVKKADGTVIFDGTTDTLSIPATPEVITLTVKVTSTNGVVKTYTVKIDVLDDEPPVMEWNLVATASEAPDVDGAVLTADPDTGKWKIVITFKKNVDAITGLDSELKIRTPDKKLVGNITSGVVSGKTVTFDKGFWDNTTDGMTMADAIAAFNMMSSGDNAVSMPRFTLTSDGTAFVTGTLYLKLA